MPKKTKIFTPMNAALEIGQKIRKLHNLKENKDLLFSRSQWIETDYGAFYLRHKFWNAFAIKREWQRGYVLATLNVYEKYKGQGLFGCLLDVLANYGEPIYIENILDKRFQHYLHKRGFLVLPRETQQLALDIPCMVRFPDTPDNPSPLFCVEDRWYYWTHDHRVNGPFATKKQAVAAHDIEEYKVA